MTHFLPITKKEMLSLGWQQADVILVSGDAYVDHPSFGTAVIGRLIESCGLKVAIIAQPNWQDDLRDFKKFGAPRLFFGVTGGAMDSMVNHYTAHKRKRSNDAYTPGGVAGFRPDYAVVTYSRILKNLYPEVPVVIGGIEASLRRFTHYDYFSDRLKPSILEESGADLLIYGMGELPLLELIRLLNKGVPFSSINTIYQTALLVSTSKIPKNKKIEDEELFSHEECIADKKKYSENFKKIERNSNRMAGRRLLQEVGNRVLVVNPAFTPMSEKQADIAYELPYLRLPHPKYKKRGAIPAYEMIKFSINTHRGCFGGCSFCTISVHQGKFISSRSEKSILNEVQLLVGHPEFKGFITDAGGPSANMYKMEGKNKAICEKCSAPSCIYPKICKNLDVNHSPMLQIYNKIENHPEIKKLFISSGLRYDLMLPVDTKDENRNSKYEYIRHLIMNNISGRLKVAPEHTVDSVLHLMRKPSFKLFKQFKAIFDDINHKKKLNQQIIPYFISSHPGSDIEAMAKLAIDTKELGYKLEQVQDFTPTPMTLSTVMYYTSKNPYGGRRLKIAKKIIEKKDQKTVFFWYLPKNRKRILEILKKKSLLEKFNKILK